MSVSAIIVTRGDVDLGPVLRSLPPEWQKLVWDNGAGKIRDWSWDQNVFAPHWSEDVNDLSVFGRYAAIEYAHNEVIYVQDDDCIVSDPRAIVYAWLIATGRENHNEHTVVCNMPQEFRHNFYEDHALVGFGAAFHRHAPMRALNKFLENSDEGCAIVAGSRGEEEVAFWRRTCDIVFTGLTPRVLIDVPKENLPWAEADNRMWKQPEHQGERVRMRELMLAVRKETS